MPIGYVLEGYSFDTVHMCSIINHSRDSELALNEAYRTLNRDGSLVIGLYVLGEKYGKADLKERGTEPIKTLT
jgi:ubiquinone/menaquinone biosynthesis C-methylase UbiE